MRILLAEDDPNSGRRLQLLLELAGHVVVRAHSGAEAFARFEEDPFPVVVADLELKAMDGYELCRRIRARTEVEYVYVILLAREGASFRLEDAEAAEVDDVLRMPVDAETLRTRLRVARRLKDLYGELDRLRGLIPICAYCKKIRQEQGLWQQIEAYISDHSHALFSHTICPECREREFGDMLQAQRSAPALPAVRED